MNSTPKWLPMLYVRRCQLLSCLGILLFNFVLYSSTAVVDEQEIGFTAQETNSASSKISKNIHSHTSAKGPQKDVNKHLKYSVAQDYSSSLVLVSTMDGTVSALSLEQGGKVLWTFSTGNGMLVSSSLNKIQVKRKDSLVQLIPSLDGSIFQFDGRNLEATSFSADSFLASSTPINEDTVMVGGKISETFGVDKNTGKVVYACGTSKCQRYSQEASGELHESLLVIRYNSQTVRAVELKTGSEKWNFSVATHEVVNVSSSKTMSAPRQQSSVDIQVVVPKGIVCGVDRASRQLLWKRELGSPVAAAWSLHESEVKPISLFDEHHVPALSHSVIAVDGSVPPMLYLGQHHSQLYVQPSIQIAEDARAALNRMFLGHSYTPARVKWKPYLATASSRTPHLGQVTEGRIEDAATEERGLALVIKNDLLEYPYDNGVYLLADSCSPQQLPHTESKREMQAAGSWLHEPTVEIVEVIIQASFTHFWKEIIVISLLLSLVFSFIKRFVFARADKQRLQSQPSRSTDSFTQIDFELEEALSEHGDAMLTSHSVSSQQDIDTEHYNSRFVEDFSVVKCLGKGGFGVVFEAVNSLDETAYAIKRIRLPDRDEARRRVLREVTSLARLDHPHIVRYFQSWEESPPLAWQRQQDRQLLRDNDGCEEVGFGLYDVTTDALDSYSRPDEASGDQPVTSFDEESLAPRHVLGEVSLEVVFEEEMGAAQTSTGFRCEEAVSFVNYVSGTPAATAVTSANSSTDNRLLIGSDVSGRRDGVAQTVKQEAGCEDRHYKFLYIQMQLCQRDTLREWLAANTLRRDSLQVLHMFQQIVSAVQYVHERGFIHRDLKPGNIFFAPDGAIKIGDFGLVREQPAGHDTEAEAGGATSGGGKHTAEVGTQLYMSPEQVAGDGYCQKVDIYALGVIFFELSVPFGTCMERVSTLQQLRHFQFPERFVKELKDEHQFVSWLLQQDPAQRPSAVDIAASDMLLPVRDIARTRTRTVSQCSSGSAPLEHL